MTEKQIVYRRDNKGRRVRARGNFDYTDMQNGRAEHRLLVEADHLLDQMDIDEEQERNRFSRRYLQEIRHRH